MTSWTRHNDNVATSQVTNTNLKLQTKGDRCIRHDPYDLAECSRYVPYVTDRIAMILLGLHRGYTWSPKSCYTANFCTSAKLLKNIGKMVGDKRFELLTSSM
jgi:hypothetical protein